MKREARAGVPVQKSAFLFSHCLASKTETKIRGRAKWTGFRAPSPYRHACLSQQQVAFSVRGHSFLFTGQLERKSPAHLALPFIFFSVSLTGWLKCGRRPDFALPLTPLLCFSQSSGFLSARSLLCFLSGACFPSLVTQPLRNARQPFLPFSL